MLVLMRIIDLIMLWFSMNCVGGRGFASGNFPWHFQPGPARVPVLK